MHSHTLDDWRHDHVFLGAAHDRNERRTWFVVGLTATMMVAEIAGGTLFGSMALLADGWHMSTHAGALAIAACGKDDSSGEQSAAEPAGTDLEAIKDYLLEHTEQLTADRATLARDAFLAGVPLVTTVRTMQTFADLIGVNRLFVTPGLVDCHTHACFAGDRAMVPPPS